MPLLAQAQEIATAATRELERAAQFGFAGYIAILLLLLFTAAVAVHFWFVVKPDQKQRRESAKTQDECLTTFATNYAVQTQLFAQFDARLSTMGKEIAAMKCPMLTAPNPAHKTPQSPFTFQPTGGA